MKESVSGCPVEEAIRLLGGRWRILLVYHLLEGKRRFSELRRAMPKISQRMLTLDLRALEQAGLVQRRIAGRDHWLSLRPDPLARAYAWLGLYQRFWEARMDALERYLDTHA